MTTVARVVATPRSRSPRGSRSARTPRLGRGSARHRRLPLRRVEVVGRVRADDLALGATRAAATVLARDLANTPSSTKGPSWLADRARRAAAEVGLRCHVRDEKDLRAEGFGGLLGGRLGGRPPAAAGRAGAHAAGRDRQRAARRARGQGHHLRHRRPVA